MPTIALILAAGVALAPPPAPSAESVALARQIMQAQHREALVRDTYGKQLRATMTFCKGDAKCQADLDRSIAQATSQVGKKQSENMAQLFARNLKPAQMQAILTFFRSSEGQAMMSLEINMTDELAQIGNASSAYARQSISRTFCAAHPDICVSEFGQRGSSPPKS